MSNPENNSIFRNKFRDFEPEHGDRWSQIEAALPREKKRRAFLWLWIGLLLVAGGSILFVTLPGSEQLDQVANYHANQPELNQETPSLGEKHVMTEPRENAAGSPEESRDYKPSEKNSPENRRFKEKTSVTEHPGIPAKPLQQSGVSPLTPTVAAAAEETPEEAGTVEQAEQLVAVAPVDSLPESPVTKTLPSPLPVVQEKKEKKNQSANPDDPGKWSMGIGFGAFSSKFTPRMPNSVGSYPAVNETMVRNNYELRRQIEKAGYVFSQSLLVNYQPTKNWSFSTGISMLQSTQILRFSIQSNRPDNVKGPGDFPEGSNSGSEYQFDNDSIFAGNTTTATNKYFGREIPFYATYHHELKEGLSLDFTLGGSYRWVRSLSAYIPDVDNVGMVYMQGPSYYPGIKGCFQVMAGIGVSYRLSKYFRLQAMPTYQMALQSNIRFEHYIQQYQKQWGCNFTLTRKLGF